MKIVKKSEDELYQVNLEMRDLGRDYEKMFIKLEESEAKVCALTKELKESQEKNTKDTSQALESKINDLSAKLDSFMSGKGSSREVPTSKPLLYSDIIKVNRATNKVAKKTTIKQAKPTAAIYPAKGSKIKNSDETKKVLSDCINPTEQKIRIRNLRKIGNSGVLIETETAEDLEQVLRNKNLKGKVEIGSLPRRKPKIIIFGVPSDTAEADINKAISRQNLEQDSEEKLGEEFKLLFKTGKRDKDVTNWVAEVSPKTREILLKRNRVFIGFNAYGVKDFIVASRCFKCQAFGHVAKHCKANVDTCGHCGKDGHVFKDCPDKEKKATCINCKRAGLPANHSTREQSCPAYKHAMEKCLSRIDFGKDTIR